MQIDSWQADAKKTFNLEKFDRDAAQSEGWTVTNLSTDGGDDGVSRQLGCFKGPDVDFHRELNCPGFPGG